MTPRSALRRRPGCGGAAFADGRVLGLQAFGGKRIQLVRYGRRCRPGAGERALVVSASRTGLLQVAAAPRKLKKSELARLGYELVRAAGQLLAVSSFRASMLERVLDAALQASGGFPDPCVSEQSRTRSTAPESNTSSSSWRLACRSWDFIGLPMWSFIPAARNSAIW